MARSFPLAFALEKAVFKGFRVGIDAACFFESGSLAVQTGTFFEGWGRQLVVDVKFLESQSESGH